MCGRYFLDPDSSALKAYLDDSIKEFARKEIFPSQKALVLVKEDKIKPKVIVWGFKKWDSNQKIINARSETVATSPFFKDSFKTRKAIVLANGFYEWDNHKNRFYISHQQKTLLPMAAIIQEDEVGFAILTQVAQPSFTLHHRQPVFIFENQFYDYLSNKLDDTLLTLQTIDFKITPIQQQTSLF